MIDCAGRVGVMLPDLQRAFVMQQAIQLEQAISEFIDLLVTFPFRAERAWCAGSYRLF
jgi:hypothetical protein